METQKEIENFKIVVIGSAGTGKSDISSRYIHNQFNQERRSTVGVEFLIKTIQVNNKNIKVTLWDISGQQRYRALCKAYFKNANGILIAYDVNNLQSYLDVQNWLHLAKQYNNSLNEVEFMVVGNKIDIEYERKVTINQSLSQCKQNFNLDVREVSAKTGQNIQQVFAELVDRIYKNHEKKQTNQRNKANDDECNINHKY